MTDLATLGLAIDSSQATQAAAALDKLVRASDTAEQAIGKFGAAAAKSASDLKAANDAASRAAVGMTAHTKATNENTQATSLNRNQQQELFAALRHSFDALASGASPMRVLATEGSKLSAVFTSGTGTGGVGAVLKGAATYVSGMVPLWLGAAGGIAAAAGIAVHAFESWDSAQRAVAMGLTGVGRGSGLTVSGLSDLARNAAGPADFSVASAREIATAIATTGKAGRAEIEASLKLAKDFAATLTGGDLSKAGEMIAGVFDNAVGSYDKLNGRLGFGTAALREHVDQLQKQGRYAEAGRVVLDALAPTLAKNADLTSYWGKQIDLAKRQWSDFWETVDRGSAIVFGKPGALGVDDDRKQLASMQAQAKALDVEIATMEQRRSKVPSLLQNQLFPIDDLKSSRETLAKTIEDTSARIVKAQEAETTAAKNGFAEEARLARERADTVLIQIRKQTDIAGMTPLQQAQRKAREDAGVDLPTEPRPAASNWFQDAFSTAANPRSGSYDNYLRSEADSARSRAQASFGTGEVNGPPIPRDVQGRIDAREQEAAGQRAMVNRGVETLKTTEITKGWTVSLQDQTSALRTELDTIGLSTDEAEKLRKATELTNAANREGISVNGDLTARINQQATAYGVLRAQVDAAKVSYQLDIERQQIGLSATENAVATRLRAAGNLDEDSVDGARIASQVRLNESLKSTKDISTGALTGFLTDLSHGTSLAQSFTHSVTGISDRLLAMASDRAISAMFSNLMSAFGGGSGNGISMTGPLTAAEAFGGFAGGGPVRGPGTATSDSIPARLSHGEFVVRASRAEQHLGLLEQINGPGLPGFAAGGQLPGIPGAEVGEEFGFGEVLAT